MESFHCKQVTLLRQELSEAYRNLEELKFLEASHDGIRYTEYEIVALHESITIHGSDCRVCSPVAIDAARDSVSHLDRLCPDSFSEPFPTSFLQDGTRAISPM